MPLLLGVLIMDTLEDRVRTLAYHLWESAGGGEGDGATFWCLAEEAVLAEWTALPSGRPATSRMANLTMPLSMCSPPTRAVPPPNSTKMPKIDFGRMSAKRVVIVDDNTQIRKLIGLALESLGVGNVAMAINGEEAITSIRNGGADIVIMDRMMDVMDGLECTRRIRNGVDGIDPRIPIILLTGLVGKGAEDAAYAAGVDLFLEKPFSIRKICSGVSKVLCPA